MRKEYSYLAANEAGDFSVVVKLNHHEIERKDWSFLITLYEKNVGSLVRELTQDQAKSLRNFLNNYLPK